MRKKRSKNYPSWVIKARTLRKTGSRTDRHKINVIYTTTGKINPHRNLNQYYLTAAK